MTSTSPHTDPLAGKRHSINTHTTTTLLWPRMVDGKEVRCPVAVGEIYGLRSCDIEITKTERITRAGEKLWMALFNRYERRPDKIHLIPRSGDGYTDDPDRAIGLREDVFHGSATTLDAVPEDARSPAHKNAGEPPEPESPPPHEVKGYRGSRDAHQRFLLEVGQERVQQQEDPIEVRLARLRAMSRSRHVDVSNDLRVIEKRIAAMEEKMERAA